MAWHYIYNGKEFGPVSVETLRFHISAENVKSTDMVRGPGVPLWTPAADVMNIIDESPDAPVLASATTSAPSEGISASVIGNAIIWLSLIGATICVFAFGRVEVPDGLYGTTTRWNSVLITIVIASGLNGIFLGYLLAKVGSVLKKLERSEAAV